MYKESRETERQRGEWRADHIYICSCVYTLIKRGGREGGEGYLPGGGGGGDIHIERRRRVVYRRREKLGKGGKEGKGAERETKRG
jgi:hypothetical protein